jgi:membrane-associated phospholipid phosphatase
VLDARVDAPLFLIPGLLSLGWLMVETPASCAPLCDPATVNSFDRSAAGNFDQNWRLASDLTLFGSLGGGVAVLLGDGGFLGGLKDFVVVAESIIWANGLAVLGNLAVRRPRPLLYGDAAPLASRENPAAALSFISGHSALVAAVTTSVFSTTYARDPDRALPWVVLGVGTAATTMASVGRVLAGRHFPSDVLIGTALGASAGFLLPAIHDAPVRLTPVATKDQGRIIVSADW